MKNLLTLVAILSAFGCGQELLDNIDNLTCAYVPWYVADCTSPEVHDKAVSIATDGLAFARLDCYIDNYFHDWKVPHQEFWVRYEATIFQDGSNLTHCNLITSSDPEQSSTYYLTESHFGSRFNPRNSPNVNKHICDISLVNLSEFLITSENGLVKVRDPQGSGLSTYSIHTTICTGHNLQAFD